VILDFEPTDMPAALFEQKKLEEYRQWWEEETYKELVESDQREQERWRQ
jgi:hypothetical protein